MNNQQRIWEALLAVHSLDELEGSLRDEVEQALVDSEPMREAWERLGALDRDVMQMLNRVDMPQEFTSRVESSLEQMRVQQEFDGVHELDELTVPALSSEQLACWEATRRFDDQVVDALEQVDVPARLEAQVLSQLLAEPDSADVTTDDRDQVSEKVSLGRDRVSMKSAIRRHPLVFGVVLAGLVAVVITLATSWPSRPLPLESLESLASTSVNALDGELIWVANEEPLVWRLRDRAEFPLAGRTATVFRQKRTGKDVFLVRLKHPLAEEMEQRIPFLAVPTSGGWHVGAWTDGTYLFLACSRDREAIELFRANIQPI
jgi:hypothetical protein